MKEYVKNLKIRKKLLHLRMIKNKTFDILEDLEDEAWNTIDDIEEIFEKEEAKK